MLGNLRSLTLESAGAKQCIPLGCRGQHPDLSHLKHLSIGPDIALCVNFLAYLSGLRAAGLGVCRSLGKVRTCVTRQRAPLCLSFYAFWEASQTACTQACGSSVLARNAGCTVLPFQCCC